MGKKNAFTLVELLATIIILALLGIIISPIISKTIETQRRKAFELSVNGIIDTVKKDAEADKFMYPRHYSFSYDTSNNSNTLTLIQKGNTQVYINVPIDGVIQNGSGVINFNNEGNLSLSISNNKFCATKNYNTDKIETKAGKCN